MTDRRDPDAIPLTEQNCPYCRAPRALFLIGVAEPHGVDLAVCAACRQVAVIGWSGVACHPSENELMVLQKLPIWRQVEAAQKETP